MSLLSRELREVEFKVLHFLAKRGARTTIKDIIAGTGVEYAALVKSLAWLEDKGLVSVESTTVEYVSLTDEGKHYALSGLPERVLLNFLVSKGGEATLKDVLDANILPTHIVNVAIGWARRKGWITISKSEVSDETVIKALPPSPVRGEDERLLEFLREKGRVKRSDIPKELDSAVDTLYKRNLLEKGVESEVFAQITSEGIKVLESGVEVDEGISLLTPDLIRTQAWKTVKLKRFNVEAPVKPAYPGKVHPLIQLINEIREIFLNMGFEEIRGPLVESAFWNFDALFTPQDHPAREMHDTFYLKTPSTAKLPDEDLVYKVAKTHENGWETGSRGWRYSWNAELAQRAILRTHTTATTIRYLAEHRTYPARVFSVDRVYRNERVDYKHLAEFHQIEGIIVDKNATLRDLMGVLREFYWKLGFKKVQFWPSFFPYTEPSIQSTVYVEEYKSWVELCGAGIFRPEVTVPLGVKVPVLAWGGGFERIAMIRLGLDDIRDLYRNSLKWLRQTPSML
ncbi:MAG: phenylalanine--tRNA ligase subunit alpha [Candidatus Jordarchaeales archaeon]